MAPKRRPVIRQQAGGKTVYRDASGKFAKKSTWKRQGEWHLDRGELISTKGAHTTPHKEIPVPVEGGRRVKSLTVWGQSLPSLIEDNAANRRDTFLKWKGRTYRVPISRSAQVADLFRVMLQVVISKMKKATGNAYPFSMQQLEADQGDVIDVDSAEFMDTDLTDELIGDDPAERAALGIRRWMDENFDDLTS